MVELMVEFFIVAIIRITKIVTCFTILNKGLIQVLSFQHQDQFRWLDYLERNFGSAYHSFLSVPFTYQASNLAYLQVHLY